MVRTRMAPSPTGNLHLGTAYASLWPYVFAKRSKGIFILRIEDTDRERSTKEFAENIIEGLKWLGLSWDEDPFYQMGRLDLYQKAAQKLVDEDKAYYCFCTKEELEAERVKQIEQKLSQVYSGKCRNLTKEEVKNKLKNGLSYVIRYKLPEGRGVVEFEDLVHGKVSFDSSLLGDMVIMRQNGIPLYNFAVVVDDKDMEITHVIRGDDHISNTPKQILFFEALGAKYPQYAHYPMILNQDRLGKLSKRTGSTALADYKHEGYLPEAIINYLALLGWTPKAGKEIISLDEIIQTFDVKDMNNAAAAWNQDKLDWINGEYIRSLTDEGLTKRLQEYLVDHPAKDKIAPIVPLIKERIKKLSDFVPLCNFFFNPPEYDLKVVEKINIDNIKGTLEKILEKMEQFRLPWHDKEFEDTFRDLSTELVVPARELFQLIRVAISGQLVSPPLFASIQILGAEETIKRVKLCLEFIKDPTLYP